VSSSRFRRQSQRFVPALRGLFRRVLETFKRIPNAELAVIPDAGHYVLFSEPERVIPVVERFLKEPEKRVPFATAETGYHPGETR